MLFFTSKIKKNYNYERRLLYMTQIAVYFSRYSAKSCCQRNCLSSRTKIIIKIRQQLFELILLTDRQTRQANAGYNIADLGEVIISELVSVNK